MTAVGRSLIFIFVFLTFPFWVVEPVCQSDEVHEVKTAVAVFPKAPESPVIEAQRDPLANKYYLEIPRLGVADEIKENVNPYDMSSYMPAITDKIARANNTDSNLIYLFAHSSRYPYNGSVSRAIFANLGDITAGDTLIINKSGDSERFIVEESKIVADTNLTPLTQKPADKTLVLQTCWPAGSLNSRLIVTAKPADKIAVNLPDDGRSFEN